MFGLFQRLRRRLGAELDAMIRHVENHEALVASAVRELEASIAHTERERGRAATTNAKLRATLREERDAASSWRARALRETVEARGIECLRRSKRCERRVHDVDQRLGESLEREARLRARGETLRANLAEFREQEALLRERQSTAHDETSPRTPLLSSLDLADLLARWEAHLCEAELTHGSPPFSLEILDEEPLDAAEEAALALELRELKEKCHE
jgi:phage shock protein A